MEKSFHFSTAKTLGNVLIYFLLFMAGEFLSSLLFDIFFSFVRFSDGNWYVFCRTIGALVLILLLFYFYTTKFLHLKMRDFRITLNIKKWGLAVSIVLPLFVVVSYIQIGRVGINKFSVGKSLLMVVVSAMIAVKSGLTEEILFRGYIMKLLEDRWNKWVAILLPSFVFALLHIPSMEKVSFESVVLLLSSGTLVGVMFSLLAYKGDSISNSACVHVVWNFVMITQMLHITPAQATYGHPFFSIIIDTTNPLLTGAGFGIEASVISMVAYACVCVYVCLSSKLKSCEEK